jgi:hypothetical protein
MTQTVELQKELQDCITRIPAHRLRALKPLLLDLAEPEYIVEQADADETALIDAGMAEYHANPSSFTTLDDFKAELRAAGKLTPA